MESKVARFTFCLALVALLGSMGRNALAEPTIGGGSRAAIVGDKNFHLRGTFNNSRIRFEHEKKGHVAFIGGSITEMNGYRPMVCEMLQKKFPHTEFTFTNAGIASTCSTTGAFRLTKDVLSKGPLDLLFVEFAVNDDQDANHTREDCIRGMEGIVTQARAHNPNVDIIITHFVNQRMLKAFRAGKPHVSVQAHSDVAEHHGISVSNLAQELADQVNAGKTTWQVYGGVHPKKHGNAMAAAMITNALSKEWARPLAASAKATPHKVRPLLDSTSYSRGRLFSSANVAIDRNWKMSVPKLNQKESGSLRGRFKGHPLLHSTTPGAKLNIKFNGTAIGAYVLAGRDSAIVKYSVDGGEAQELDTTHRFSGSLLYPRTVMFFNDLDDREHTFTLEIRARETDHDKRWGGSALRVVSFVVNESR